MHGGSPKGEKGGCYGKKSIQGNAGIKKGKEAVLWERVPMQGQGLSV